MNNSNDHTSTLHHCHIHKLHSLIYTTHSFLHIISLLAIFHYRATFFLYPTDTFQAPLLPWILLSLSELLFSFIWVLKQPFYWRLASRSVFAERLPKDEDLPGLDVFICTADPSKEPTFDVMNTVISVMSLGYPSEKLSVYLSDDGGCSCTMDGLKEAWVFATWWLPFCRRYGVRTICPKAYFEMEEEESDSWEFIEQRKALQEKYEAFKLRVQSKSRRDSETDDGSAQNHPSLVQVINKYAIEDADATINPDYVSMPSLVYVAREKRLSHLHHFKAGALNVLLRVSAVLSNSPYILILDCDMYCNDTISARQAMCFHLDPKISPSLGWVQFPQMYHNVCENDIYDSQLRYIWKVCWPGANGLQGPVISGTNFYIKRKVLYGIDINDGYGIKLPRDAVGPSNEFIKSLRSIDMPNEIKPRDLSSVSVQEAQLLASCTYEENTSWGEKLGFRYESVVEDAMTGYMLQHKGWRSVYLSPERPQFLGSATTNLNEYLVQNSRWASGLLEIGLSRYSPLFYTPSRMGILQRMSSFWITICPLGCISVWCFATIPQISFLYGFSLYPKVSDPFFIAFAFVFLSSLLKLIFEILSTGHSISTWLNEERIWKIKSLTSYSYAILDSAMTKLGFRDASFIPTNKAEDKDTTMFYKMGKYDFRISHMFLVPIVTVVSLNMFCLFGGFAKVIALGNWNAMFCQVLISIYILLLSFPVLEGMFIRQDSGCIPWLITLSSSLFAVGVLTIGYLSFLY